MDTSKPINRIPFKKWPRQPYFKNFSKFLVILSTLEIEKEKKVEEKMISNFLLFVRIFSFTLVKVIFAWNVRMTKKKVRPRAYIYVQCTYMVEWFFFVHISSLQIAPNFYYELFRINVRILFSPVFAFIRYATFPFFPQFPGENLLFLQRKRFHFCFLSKRVLSQSGFCPRIDPSMNKYPTKMFPRVYIMADDKFENRLEISF